MIGLLGAAYAIWWALGKRRHYYEIWGDGIHDDAPGLQRLIDRGNATIIGGHYRLGSVLHIRPEHHNIVIRDCWFR
jgi:hypothetical protein